MIKFLDLKKSNSKYTDDMLSVFKENVESGVYIGGEQVKKFEDEFAKFNESEYCVSCANGLDAIRIALESFKILGKLKDYDKVAIPANTYIATALAVNQAKLTPVLFEPNEATMLADANGVKKILETDDIKCVISVNLYGKRCNSKAIRNLGDFVYIEDSAQSHNAMYDNSIKTYADVSTFSFYPGKNLGALGDGGAIITDNEEIAKIARAYANYGSHIKYVNNIKGINSRLDPIQASILSLKLKHLEANTILRRQQAKKYIEEINNINIIKPDSSTLNQDAWHLFVIRLRNEQDRIHFINYMKCRKIETLIHYPIPIHKQLAYSEFKNLSFPITEKIQNTCVSIPLGEHLNNLDIEFIIKIINEYK